MTFLETLKINNINYLENALLKDYTTWKIGGPAEILVITNNTSDLITVAKLAQQFKIPLTILGSGSNVLINSQGLKGVVIINRCSKYSVLTDLTEQVVLKSYQPRLDQINTQTYYSFAEFDYTEENAPRVEIEVDSGYNLTRLTNELISQGITGLQWYGGIPGTIGGAVLNNIHGGNHFIGEVVVSVKVLTSKGEIREYSHDELDFAYDHSRFHNSSDIIISIRLRLFRGDSLRASKTVRAWAQKKSIQPFNTAGCCFKNISAQEKEQLKLESSSWGYIIEHILGLKGMIYGKAQISTKHAAFIENLGGATSNDILHLLKLISSTAYQKIGIKPKTEIFFLGFQPQEIQEFI